MEDNILNCSKTSSRDKFDMCSITEISLEEAIKNLELEYGGTFLNPQLGDVIKTPVSMLQEMLARDNIQPSYEPLECTGVSQLTFGCKVSVQYKGDYYSAIGQANSKKSAKHAAAKALIDKLTNSTIKNNTSNDISSHDNSLSTTSSNTSFCNTQDNDKHCEQQNFDLSISSSSSEEHISNNRPNHGMSKIEDKNSVSLLQELLVRYKIVPSYELVSSEESAHNSAICYRVSFYIGTHYITATGLGKSKKEAKQAAAKGLILKICSARENTAQEVSVEGFEEAKEATKSTNIRSDVTLSQTNVNDSIPDCKEVLVTDEIITGNPVGKLQEICAARRSLLPNYEVVNEKGLPHQKQFTVICKLGKYDEIGCGFSIKAAKRHAASKMLKRLQQDCTEDLIEFSHI